ncbi:MAG: hypothetical protein CVU89_17215 [Firmicutes bacterium HGW-Firmicutes-14]|nr:MAG: hypothetical protein CVU89_17215 [Firmicutes bacterium HGW-Firmicutes-14]
MLCEKCQKKQASVHVTKIVNGEKTETNLCETCAQGENAVGFGFEPQWMLQNIFADLFNQPLAGGQPVTVSRGEQVRCERCGFTESQFSKIGKLGCAGCYDIFETKLDPVLRRVHGNSRHTGKIPKRTGGLIVIKKEILDLKEKLQTAIKKEEYEKAAEIRDQIRGLEKKLE